mmetsp:Transcript_9316/g.20425  ORF Transcript_9316/g.20425 Transcript_9316/m.20425 type:complete len:352 (+) Transcript_9316:3761-4816(+)
MTHTHLHLHLRRLIQAALLDLVQHAQRRGLSGLRNPQHRLLHPLSTLSTSAVAVDVIALPVLLIPPVFLVHVLLLGPPELGDIREERARPLKTSCSGLNLRQEGKGTPPSPSPALGGERTRRSGGQRLSVEQLLQGAGVGLARLLGLQQLRTQAPLPAVVLATVQRSRPGARANRPTVQLGLLAVRAVHASKYAHHFRADAILHGHAAVALKGRAWEGLRRTPGEHVSHRGTQPPHLRLCLRRLRVSLAGGVGGNRGDRERLGRLRIHRTVQGVLCTVQGAPTDGLHLCPRGRCRLLRRHEARGVPLHTHHLLQLVKHTHHLLAVPLTPPLQQKGPRLHLCVFELPPRDGV